jgi:hypothetical protein
MELFIILLFIAIALQLAAFALWAINMRPYLKENGLATLRGINYAATVLNDVQQIIELSKKTKIRPAFLTVFYVLEVASISLFTLSVILGKK